MLCQAEKLIPQTLIKYPLEMVSVLPGFYFSDSGIIPKCWDCQEP